MFTHRVHKSHTVVSAAAAGVHEPLKSALASRKAFKSREESVQTRRSGFCASCISVAVAMEESSSKRHLQFKRSKEMSAFLPINVLLYRHYGVKLKDSKGSVAIMLRFMN